MDKNLDGAITESKKAIEGENKLEAYIHLANLYIIKKDLSSAEEMLKAAVKVDEKSLRGRFALAEFYFRSGKKNWLNVNISKQQKLPLMMQQVL
ncbi:MAG: hypothetical protein MZV70_22985 [Desulfobacterales bacterium]|nr:hypothetical protein [Desulfobacterales bacterium]